MRSRPVPVNVAAILLALCSLLSLPGPLLPGSEGVPGVVLYSGIVLGIVGLVAAVGLWMLNKWSLWLTIVVSVLNILSAAPGEAFAPNAALQVAATVTVLVFALIIVLVVGFPSSRRALAASL
jgi:hypothetical protein